MELTGKTAFAPAESREAVLARWYDEYGTDVLRLCCFYLGNRADGEDAAQETFLKIWRKMDGFENRSHNSLRSWIMTVACNTCRDHFRKSYRRHETAADMEAALHAQCARQEDRELMMDVMRLPEKYRTVILLIYLEGMTLQETARVIRVSPSTVCRRLGKARSLLKG